MPLKKRASPELTEIRTILSRARTALKTIDNYSRLRACGDRYVNTQPSPADHEISMMRSALMTSIAVLEDAEKLAGWKVTS